MAEKKDRIMAEIMAARWATQKVGQLAKIRADWMVVHWGIPMAVWWVCEQAGEKAAKMGVRMVVMWGETLAAYLVVSKDGRGAARKANWWVAMSAKGSSHAKRPCRGHKPNHSTWIRV